MYRPSMEVSKPRFKVKESWEERKSCTFVACTGICFVD
jgi:hypothetical protein